MQISVFNVVVIMALFSVAQAFAEESGVNQLAPPQYTVMDDFGVNMVSLQPTTRVVTTSIGGDMGLTHTSSTHMATVLSNHLNTFGFDDKFGGNARSIEFGKTEYLIKREIMKVFDHDGSMEFEYFSDGQFNPGSSDKSSHYSYVAVGDFRHKLNVAGANFEFLDWTKPDGTVTRFYRGNNAAMRQSGRHVETTYPNGFKIINHKRNDYYHVTGSVSTNTGFQLKYEYEKDSRLIDAAKKSVTHTAAAKDRTYDWAGKNPKRIVALNNAIEFCDFTSSPFSANKNQCTYENDWPTAKFYWPAGMPRAFHIGQSEASIVDAQGRSSIYKVQAIDTHWASTIGEFFEPRLVSYQSAGSTSPDVYYGYKNLLDSNNHVIYEYTYVSQAQVLISAYSNKNGSSFYSRIPGRFPWEMRHEGAREGALSEADNFKVGFVNSSKNTFGKHASINQYGYIPGRLTYIANAEQRTNFPYTNDTGTYGYAARNLPNFTGSFSYLDNNPTTQYTYSASGHLNGVYTRPAKNSSDTKIFAKVAEYVYEDSQVMSDCTKDDAKCANKPRRIFEGWGEPSGVLTTFPYTSFTYHRQSGNIASVTYPANEQGMIAQARYTYNQYAAQFYHPDGVKRASQDLIWLKTTESACANSNYTNGSCDKNDEVITSYEYEHDNLLLTSVVVSALNTAGERVTTRTCYQYDIYGNKIGEISPNADLSSCPK